MSKGYVYILSNESMPGLVKIGKTTRSVEARINELYQTGVPTRFEEIYSVLSPDCDELEAAMHKVFREHRVSEGREFFKVDALRAIDTLCGGLEQQVQEWASDFLPDHIVVRSHCVPDPSVIAELAAKSGIHPFQASSAFELMRPEEFRPLADRYKATISKQQSDEAENVVKIGAGK